MEEKYPKAYLRELAHKWKTRNLTAGEKADLEDWYNSHQDELLELPEDLREYPYQLKDRITANVLTRINPQPAGKMAKIFKFWPRIAAAASIIICLGVGYYFYQHRAADGLYL